MNAKEACAKSGHAVADHFAEMRNMIGIGSGAQREDEDDNPSSRRYAVVAVKTFPLRAQIICATYRPEIAADGSPPPATTQWPAM